MILWLSGRDVSTQTCIKRNKCLQDPGFFMNQKKRESAGEIAISAKAELPRHGQREKMHRVSSFLNVLSL